jgi:hypothetical protein
MQREEIEEKVAASNERMAQRKARQVRAHTQCHMRCRSKMHSSRDIRIIAIGAIFN